MQKTQDKIDQGVKVAAIEKWTFILQVATLLFGVIITILGYFYIERFKAQESKARSEVSSFELLKLTTEIRPNYKVEFGKWDLSEDGLALQISYQASNNGKHSILVKKELINVYFTKNNKRLNVGKNENLRLIDREDFTYNHHGVSNLGLNEKLKGEIVFKFEKPLDIPVDITLTFIVELDPAIVAMLQKNDLLKNEDAFDQLTKTTHTECFTLIN